MQFEDSEQLCSYMADKTGGTVLLSFSMGKDSIGAWIQLRRHFDRVVPFYYYLVPGLSFVEKSIRYYEDFFGCHIYRLPNPQLYRMINNLVFQAPENCRVVEEAGLAEFDLDTLADILRMELGLEEGCYVATGVRAVDSPNRWASIKKYGPVNEGRRAFYPIYDWRKARLVEELRAAQVRLPVDYRLFGRTFDGLDYRFLKPIYDHYPEDWQKIVALFPLAELELRRMAYRQRYYQQAGGAG